MNNFQIASLLTKVVHSSAEIEELTENLKTISNSHSEQVDFFEYCKKWKLAPWIFVQLNRNNLLQYLSEDVQQSFSIIHSKTKEENEKRNKEALRFLTMFKEQNIDVIVLKGNLFANTVYKDVGYKKMNDFDILIKKADWGKIQHIYSALGYLPLGFGWSGEKQKPADYSHVGMSFISQDYSCIIGSQWGLKSPTTSFKVPIEEAWETASDFNFFGVIVKQLSPSFNLLHLILHMGIFKCGIRDCMDVYNLILTTNYDANELTDLLKRSNAIDKAYFTFSLSNICSHSLKSLLDKLYQDNDNYIMHRLKKRLALYDRTGDLHTSYNDYFQDIEKIVIYFNLFPEFHKKLFFYLKILSSIFFPETEIALKLSDKSDKPTFINKFMARIKAPYFVFSLIAQEIGWTFTFLLFLKLFIDLLLSVKNYFIKKESYFDYLRKLGIDPKTIEKVVKNIQ